MLISLRSFFYRIFSDLSNDDKLACVMNIVEGSRNAISVSSYMLVVISAVHSAEETTLVGVRIRIRAANIV